MLVATGLVVQCLPVLVQRFPKPVRWLIVDIAECIAMFVVWVFLFILTLLWPSDVREMCSGGRRRDRRLARR
jgi:hypothetical protein